MGGGKARIDALIVNYQSSDRVLALAQALEADSQVAQVIIVNNDQKESRQLQEEVSHLAKVTLHETVDNIGYGRGMNLAAKQAEAPYLALINPDITLLGESLAPLITAMEQTGVDLVGPRLIAPGGAVWRTAFARSISLSTIALDFVASRLGEGTPIAQWLRAKEGSDLSFRGARQVAALTGALWLIRRTTFEVLGGFDERFFLYTEESEFCDRLNAAGFRVGFAPSVCVVHEGGHSVRGRRMTAQRVESLGVLYEIRGHRLLSKCLRSMAGCIARRHASR